MKFKYTSNQNFLDEMILVHIDDKMYYITKIYKGDNNIDSYIEDLQKFLEDFIPLHSDFTSLIEHYINVEYREEFMRYATPILRKLKIDNLLN